MATTEKLIADFHSLVRRGVHILLIYSEGLAYYNYRQIFKDEICSLRPSEFIQTKYLISANHGFTLSYNQEILTETICEWVHAVCYGTKYLVNV